MKHLYDHEFQGKVVHEPYWDELLDQMSYNSLGRVSAVWEANDGSIWFDMESGERLQYNEFLVTEEESALFAVQPRNQRKMLK